MTDEERLSALKRQVDKLKTDLAINKNKRDSLLEDLKPLGITSVKEAEKDLPITTKLIDKKEEEKNAELKSAETYLEECNA